LKTQPPEVWLAYGDEAYLAARLLWFTGFPVESALSAHRGLERYFKAYLTASGVRMEGDIGAWGRNIDTMRSVASAFDEAFRGDDVRARTRALQRLFKDLREPADARDRPAPLLSWAGVIAPADDLVAFLRPRVRVDPQVWPRLPLAVTAAGDGRPNPFRSRALSEHNPHLDIILCADTCQPTPDFQPLPGPDS
jgi:hypothetical protein